MKLVFSAYDLNTGKSKCIVYHLGEYFEGYSQLLKEDKEKASKFAGCRFAELKAEIKALKYELKIEKAKCEECRKFVKTFSTYKNFEKDSATAKCVFKQLNKRIKKVNELIDKINDKQEELTSSIRRQDIITKALDRKKALNKNN